MEPIERSVLLGFEVQYRTGHGSLIALKTFYVEFSTELYVQYCSAPGDSAEARTVMRNLVECSGCLIHCYLEILPIRGVVSVVQSFVALDIDLLQGTSDAWFELGNTRSCVRSSIAHAKCLLVLVPGSCTFTFRKRAFGGCSDA